MNYELEALKKEVDHFKYELTRKVEDENFRRLLEEVKEAKRFSSNLHQTIYDMQRQIAQLFQLLETKIDKNEW